LTDYLTHRIVWNKYFPSTNTILPQNYLSEKENIGGFLSFWKEKTPTENPSWGGEEPDEPTAFSIHD
jgi:hypothetical protein